ncbi:Short-chain-enoyl- hydratase [Lecanosticta acicola]|uniref:Short-chain-enoyl- hydratase n=1 Tax=Lecanosticta acicola TaxID=111012 RepID=A0AAI8YWQ2_9PEZI|nr:Short-chain-enoyl- hydratase [Lecanosticta acicola]
MQRELARWSMRPSTRILTTRRGIRAAGAVGAKRGLASKGPSSSRAVTSGKPAVVWQVSQPLLRRAYSSLSSSSTSEPDGKQPGVFHQIQDIPSSSSSSSGGQHSSSSIATITISNPTKLNIVNTRILQDLCTVCEELSNYDDTSSSTSSPPLRCVILTGALPSHGKPPSFIAGADITEMKLLTSPAEAKTFITKIHAACTSLRRLPVPVIGRVDGFCLGAGLEILASCDLRIATQRSTFGMPEVAIGIPSVVEAALLPGLIGMGRTRRLLYLAERIDAREAERWGLVERVVETTEALDQGVEDWWRRIADMGTGAVRLQKRLMQRWENCHVDGGIAAGVEVFAEAFEDGGEEARRLMGERFLGRRR